MTPTHTLIDRYAVLSGKTNAQIAKEAGFPRANVISMLRKGKMKVPLRRAPALARAIGVNPLHLASRVMSQEDWSAIVEIIPQAAVAAQKERA